MPFGVTQRCTDQATSLTSGKRPSQSDTEHVGEASSCGASTFMELDRVYGCSSHSSTRQCASSRSTKSS